MANDIETLKDTPLTEGAAMDTKTTVQRPNNPELGTNPHLLRTVALIVLILATARLVSAAGPTRVLLYSQDATSAANVLVGSGITLPDGRTPRPVIGPDGELVWHKTREGRDLNGLNHVFYQQYLHATGPLAAALPPPYAAAGVPVVGTAMGLHLKDSTSLQLVYGHQLDAAVLSNRLLLRTPRDAAYAGLAAVLQSRNYDPSDPATMPAAAREAWERSSELFLRTDTSIGQLRLTWRIVVPGATSLGRVPVIDAETGALVAFQEVAAGGSCAADCEQPGYSCAGNTVNGYSYPQWSSTTFRYVPATRILVNPPPGKYWEAHWPMQSPYNPAMDVFHPTSEGAFCFYPNILDKIGLIQLGQDASGTPLYGDPINASAEREAGDVLWYSRRTFELTNSLGWPGYSGNIGSPAKVEIDRVETYLRDGCAFYYQNSSGWAPADMVLCGNAFAGFRQPTACMDVIAHEWGHGVAKYGAGPQTYDGSTTAAQLHEGFADVIGHMVERAYPNDTPTYDWTMFEDCNATDQRRPADQYVCPPQLCYFRGQTLYTDCWVNGSLGSCPQVSDPHRVGHMASVAFYLLADGGTQHKNPACIAGVTGAPCTVVNAMGMSTARRIFFDTLVWYMSSTTAWEDLPALAVRAAFDDFNNCAWGKGPALGIQQATAQAFTAIGYPYTGPWHYCP